MKVLLFILFLLSQLSVFGQDRDHFNRLLEKFRSDMERMNKAFEDGMFSDTMKEFKKLMDEVHSHSMDNFFNNDSMDKILKQMRPFDKMNAGQVQWLETPKERILILKLDIQKDTPVDIQIKQDRVVVKTEVTKKTEHKGPDGSVSTSSYTSHFNQTFDIPEDVDSKKAKVDNEAGKITIKFPKVQVDTSKKRRELPKMDKNQDRRPLDFGGGNTI